MNKAQIIKTIRQAKREHIEMIKQGRSILQGVPRSAVHKPINGHSCFFGKWYDQDGVKFVNIPELITLKHLHNEIHQAYTALYYMTFERRKAARTVVITAGAEIPVDETRFRYKKFKQLEKKAIQMAIMLNAIEKQIERMDNTYFKSVWFA